MVPVNALQPQRTSEKHLEPWIIGPVALIYGVTRLTPFNFRSQRFQCVLDFNSFFQEVNEGIKEGAPVQNLLINSQPIHRNPVVILMRVQICIFLLEAVRWVQINTGFTGILSKESVQVEVLESFRMYRCPKLGSWQLTERQRLIREYALRIL